MADVTEQEFIESGSGQWSRLRELAQTARHHGIAALTADELISLSEGYRRTAADLAYAQTHFPGSDTLAELNALVGSAHGFLYAAPPRRLARLWRFYATDVPRLVRANIGPVALAGAILFGTTALAFSAALGDARLGRSLLPANMRDVVSERLDSRTQEAAFPSALGPVMSSYIMVNNIQVGFAAFAGGMLAGTYTVYTLVTNGLMLGALAGLFTRAGLALPFLALVVPHGALELPAIALTAGAGFVIAEAILNPGEQTRSQALLAAANKAVRIVLGAVPVLVVAALIEGFVTPAPAPASLKMAIGGAAFLLLAAWLGLAGRRDALKEGT